jgi:hypothetical protein
MCMPRRTVCAGPSRRTARGTILGLEHGTQQRHGGNAARWSTLAAFPICPPSTLRSSGAPSVRMPGWVSVPDLSPLGACSQLEELWMARNFKITSLAPLKACPWLRKLDLRDCYVLPAQVEDLRLSEPNRRRTWLLAQFRLCCCFRQHSSAAVQVAAAYALTMLLVHTLRTRPRSSRLGPSRCWCSCRRHITRHAYRRQQRMRFSC